ncbi:MAG: type I restriction enzyme HsdR N-terminal domain-containing protein [Candidatus Poribacteria bacterium]|nr:type I restriction enzyme HsdR N-terminal domain-containing protein [Candidatus Poribacteria bacterium]
MDFIEKIRNLSTSIEAQKDRIQTEAATKTVCVIPFIERLEYDVSNLTDVVPEYNADFGTKKAEKVDYAIFKDDKVIMLIECKPFGTDLADDHVSQLYRYFSVVDARIAILTNGDLYQFYADLEERNKMDNKPFLEFNMLDVQQQWVNELNRFSKSAFNLDAILAAAIDLKYTQEIKRILREQLEAPSENFVRFFLSSVYNGEETPAVVQQFTDIVSRVLKSVEFKESDEFRKPEDKHWTAERFLTLIDDAEYRADYASRNQIEKLCQLGADLMALVEREQWDLPHGFKKYYFAFYVGKRRVFGVDLSGHPRLLIWLPEDVIATHVDSLDGQYSYNYDASHKYGAFDEHATVADLEKLLKDAYSYHWDRVYGARR